MRRTPRFVVLALPLLLLVAARWLHPASVQPTPGLRPTIEPTLPLTLDLRALPADPARGEPPRLEATLVAWSDLRDVSLSLVLPEDVDGDPGTLSADRASALPAGEKRVYIVPLQARRAGAFPVRLEAFFRLPDGTVLHTQQGVLWRSGITPPEGRHHAGAYEWMGVPVAEPQP